MAARSEFPAHWSAGPLISGCPVDAYIFYCLIHYAHDLMLLGVLVLVGAAGVAMRKSQN
jgi:hypothetical protein